MKKVFRKPPEYAAYELKAGVPLPSDAFFITVEGPITEGMYVQPGENRPIVDIRGWVQLKAAVPGEPFDPVKHKLLERKDDGTFFARDLEPETHIVWENGVPVPYSPGSYRENFGEVSPEPGGQ